MAKILLIEDDAELLEVLAMDFEDLGHAVTQAIDGEVGLAKARSLQPDLIVSDVNMPRVDGFGVCRQLRAEGNPVPIILLTSRDSEIDEALGLEFGADDYLSKPFSTRILMARVAALLRRDALRVAGSASKPTLTRGALGLDGQRLEVTFAGSRIETTVTEFRLLEILAGRPGNVFSRTRILDLLRGDDTVVSDRIVDTYVRRLRRKFEAIDPSFDLIETVIGAGYRWRD